MKIQLKFFASLREVLQTASDTLECPSGTTAYGVRQLLIQRGEPWASALAEGQAVRMALNHEMIHADQNLTEGSELAFFPPVTGG